MFPAAAVTVTVTVFRPTVKPVTPETEALASALTAIALAVTEVVRGATSKIEPAAMFCPLTKMLASEASRLSGVTNTLKV